MQRSTELALSSFLPPLCPLRAHTKKTRISYTEPTHLRLLTFIHPLAGNKNGDIMLHNPLVIHDIIRNCWYDFVVLGFEPGFFEHFARSAGDEGFGELEVAAGGCPFALVS